MASGISAKIINDSKSGLTVRAGDYKSLAKAVVKLQKMKIKKRAAMGQNAILFSQKEFNKENILTMLELQLENLARNETYL